MNAHRLSIAFSVQKGASDFEAIPCHMSLPAKQVVFFGDDPPVTGFSMIQLIETSLISAHFADASWAIYLDVFSCAPYEPEEVAEFAKEYFKAAKYNVNVVYRK